MSVLALIRSGLSLPSRTPPPPPLPTPQAFATAGPELRARQPILSTARRQCQMMCWTRAASTQRPRLCWAKRERSRYRPVMIDPSLSLFRCDGDRFVPTELTTGPWRPDAMHGGPPAALIARAMHRALEEGEVLARAAVDLEAPVPLEPLCVDLERRELSRRVSKIDVALRAGESQVASGSAVVLRPTAFPSAERTSAPPPKLAGPDQAVPGSGAFHDAPVVYHRDAIEYRWEVGGFDVEGPSVVWIRLLRPVVEGESTSALENLFAVADFGSPIAHGLHRSNGLSDVTLINVDVSLSLSRMPSGHWMRLECVDAFSNPAGNGISLTRIWDTEGFLGAGSHTQLGYGPPPASRARTS